MTQKIKPILFFAIAGIIIAVTGKMIASRLQGNSATTAEEAAWKETCSCASKCTCNSTGAMELKTDMRKLWEDHVEWTRNVIFCIVDDLPGADQTVNRLLKNQDDIGDAVANYYGKDAGKQLTTLLKTHITTAADLLKALKADNKAALDDANKKWIDNADEISAFLSKANPNWKLDDMKKMMHDHLKLTTDEAVARKKKNYDDDVKAYDKVHKEILEMSDMLTEGIVKQYPDKFKSSSSSMGMK